MFLIVALDTFELSYLELKTQTVSDAQPFTQVRSRVMTFLLLYGVLKEGKEPTASCLRRNKQVVTTALLRTFLLLRIFSLVPGFLCNSDHTVP